jgi:branched-chain amino acid transport system permease protein
LASGEGFGVVSQAFNTFYQFQDSFTFLVLAALGLAVIFGMMGVVNLAHGELMMIGAYITTWTVSEGIPLPLGLLISAVAVGLIGAILELLVVRRLYGRLLDTVAATWAIGLIMRQVMLLLFGPSIASISSPLGSFRVGDSTYSWYRLILGACAVGLLLGIYLLFMHTRFGLRARATIQNAEIANAMGVDTSRIYTLTFAFGCALAGVTGGLYAPTMVIVPHLGTNFMVEAFVTVIVGGADVLVGIPLAGAVLGAVNSLLAQTWGTYIARVGLLVATIIVIRVAPDGFSGLADRWRIRMGSAR